MTVLLETAPSNNDRIYQIIDRVLEGTSPAIKARVWELIKRKQIEPDDEMLLLFIALNHLEVLIEQAPVEWKNVLNLYEKELSKLLLEYREFVKNNNQSLSVWSNNNRNILEQIAEKVKTMEDLASSSKELSQSAAELLVVCGDLSGTLGNSNSQSAKSLVELNSLKDNLSSAIAEIPKLPEKIGKKIEPTIDSLIDRLIAKKNKANWKDNIPSIASGFLSLLCLGSLFVVTNSLNTHKAMMKIGIENLSQMVRESGMTNDAAIKSLIQEMAKTPSATVAPSSTYPHYNNADKQKYVRGLLVEVYRSCLETSSPLKECQMLLGNKN